MASRSSQSVMRFTHAPYLILCFFHKLSSVYFPGLCRSSNFSRALSTVTLRNRLMTQPRLYKRITPSGLMSRTGQIIVGPKSPALTCRVIDYSAGGACLDIYGLGTVPDRFEFLYGGVKKKIRVVWRRGIRIGVAF